MARNDGKAVSIIPNPLTMMLGVPGANDWATLRLVDEQSGEMSNPIAVPYRVVETPPAK